jgi:hypothetical protein
VDALKEQFDQGVREFKPGALPPPETHAREVLEQVAADGWLQRVTRLRCGHCGEVITDAEATGSECPHCGSTWDDGTGLRNETIFVHDPPARRSVEWVVAVHGMNTAGAWQEAFTWLIGTTWGRSVPVAVYKYGIVIAGVIMPWRRRRLQHALRAKISALRTEARRQGYDGNPDLIAHSFGTWLIGHLLLDELKRQAGDRLSFGRIILTGCILRPDFDWKAIREAGLVEDILNYYGNADGVVPLAQATIWDSGPSGRRGFDGDQVINVRAEGFGHGDFFSLNKLMPGGKSALDYSYERYWRPFLTLSGEELADLPDRSKSDDSWRPYIWMLRGTLFPLMALPLVGAAIIWAVASIGTILWPSISVVIWLIAAMTSGLAVIAALIALTLLRRRVSHS